MDARKIATAPARGLKALAQMVFRPAGTWRWWWLPATRFNYRREVGDGTNSSVVMAPLLWIARNFPEAPPALWAKTAEGEEERVVGEGEQGGDHLMLELIEKPNPYYSDAELWMATLIDWLADGNAYWIKIRDQGGRPIELWWVPSFLVEPEPDPNDDSVFIDHYAYRPGAVTISLPPEDVIHFRYGLDPVNQRKGCSPLKSVLREVFTDDEAANFTASLLRNMGVPGLVISPEGDIQPGTDDVQATKDYTSENFTGDRRGEPLVMSGPTKVQQFGFSPDQLNLKDLRRIPEERVTAVVGLPAIVCGLGAGLDRSTFANYKEAREAAFEDNIIPAQRILARVIQRQLLPDFEPDRAAAFRFGFDLKNVRVLQEDRKAQAERLEIGVRAGYVRVAEARRASDLETDEADEVYLRPLNVVVTPAGQMEPLLPELPEPPGAAPPGDDEPPEELDDDEPDTSRRKMWTKQANRTGAMVALYPSPSVAEQLAQEGGEPVDQLHLTLAFLGDADQVGDPDRLRSVVEGVAATIPPLTGEVSGVGHFTAGPEPVTYASADIPALPVARERLVDALRRAEFPVSRDHGFTPHITLAYEQVEPDVPNLPLEFDQLSVVLAGERTDFPLTGIEPKRRRRRKEITRAQAGLGQMLARDVNVLAAVFANEVASDLADLGQLMADAYLDLAEGRTSSLNGDHLTKADGDEMLVRRLLDVFDLAAWSGARLRARFATHYRRVASRTVDTINQALDLGLTVTDLSQTAISDAGAARHRLLDIPGDTRQALIRAIGEGTEAGENPRQVARRIRSEVSAGRWRNAGPKYRAELIARTETLHAQRLSSLSAYRDSPLVNRVTMLDGQGARTDADCAARNGVTLPLAEAEGEMAAEHPNGTLTFVPVVEPAPTAA